jgi:hypothetical protein
MVIAIRYGSSIIDGEMQSDVGELGQILQADGTFITPAPPPPTLDDVKNAKIAELTAVNNSASASFTSTALGTSHTYLSDADAMSKFNAEYTFVNGPDWDGQPILWFTIEEGGVEHTKDQFNQVWLDGRNHVATNFNKWDSLVKQVKACTTIDEVNSIVW